MPLFLFFIDFSRKNQSDLFAHYHLHTPIYYHNFVKCGHTDISAPIMFLGIWHPLRI